MIIQKKLASKIAKRSGKKIKLVPEKLDEIKEAITRADIRALIKDGVLKLEPSRGVSRGRTRKNRKQRVLGRKRGHGSRKGKSNARFSFKKRWMNKVRLQRVFLKNLKIKKRITQEIYKDLYKKSKGGFFRSKRDIKLYITEHKLVKK